MDRQKIERSIKGLSEWQMHVQAESDIDTNISTAIEALKAQLSQEDTTKDAISRTETVEHLRRVIDATVPITDYDEGYVDGVEFGISTVSTMPTIQPQSTVGQLNDGAQSTAQSTDLIDRQQAIDALDCINGTEEVLRSLPSAQPEYEIAAVEDFAKTMSENTLYNFMAWNNVAFTLMNEMGFVICKKTM